MQYSINDRIYHDNYGNGIIVAYAKSYHSNRDYIIQFDGIEHTQLIRDVGNIMLEEIAHCEQLETTYEFVSDLDLKRPWCVIHMRKQTLDGKLKYQKWLVTSEDAGEYPYATEQDLKQIKRLLSNNFPDTKPYDYYFQSSIACYEFSDEEAMKFHLLHCGKDISDQM